MILATYQCDDYLNWKNNRFSKLKQLLNISQDTNLYWCISANNIYQVIINSYVIHVNQPSLFVMFETENFYKLDAIKWNHYVETKDESLLTEDLFNIEHDDAIEYLVTSIPDFRFEVDVQPTKLIDLFLNQNNKYMNSISKYFNILFVSFEHYPNPGIIEQFPFVTKENIDSKLLLLLKYHLMFKAYFLIPLYLIGLDYLNHPMTKICDIKIISLNELSEILIRHESIYANYDNIETLYKRYINFYNFLYNKIFVKNKLYPNEPCPCGSGLKYKKCCMKNNKLLYKYLIE